MQPENTRQAETALVIGGGIVGLCCAINLQLRGVSTVVVEPDPARRGVSWGNAGHIAVEQVEPLASPVMVRGVWRRLFWRGGALALPAGDITAWLPFSLRLLAAARPAPFAAGKAALRPLLAGAMPAWARLLEQAEATDLLLQDGHFVVWETPEGAAAGRAAWAAADTGTATFRDATGEELARISAQMKNPPSGAIRFEGSGQIADTGELAERLVTCFERLGGRQLATSIDRLVQRNDAAEAVTGEGERLAADIVVVAAGVASAALLALLGHKVPMIAERGYHIQSAGSAWPHDLPPVVFEDRSMIVTRFRSGLRASGFVEFGRAGGGADPRKWARLRRHVSELGLPFDLPGEPWMGARPTLPDYIPAIGRSRRAANLFYAFGHQHLGLTLAPVTAEMLADAICGERPATDLRPYDLERFERRHRRRHPREGHS